MPIQQSPSSSWLRTGSWPGGTVTAVAIAGRALLAASRAGLFRSTDDGATWQRCQEGIPDPSLLTLATIPGEASGPILAGSEQGRLYRSTDDGVHWQELAGWAGLGVITSLTLSPNYAHDRTIFAATMDGPFRSHDGGATWESATFGLVDIEVLCIAVDPQFGESETLWIGTANGGLYRSRNGGRSWRDAGAGLPDQAMQCLLTLRREDQTELFVGVEEDGIYHSPDGGATWQQMLAGPGVSALAALPEGMGLLAASDEGILLSADAVTWQPGDDARFIALSLASGNHARAIAGAWQEGLYISENSGQSWRQANGDAQPLAVHVPPLVTLTPAGELFAADLDGGWVCSMDRGATWQPVGVALENPVDVLVGGGNDGDALLAGSGHTLFRRGNQGEWEAIEVPFAIAQVVPSPNYREDRTLLLVSREGTLHRSGEDGAAWQPLATPWGSRTLLNLAFSPQYAHDGTIYAVTAYGQQNRYQVEVWRTGDRGESWIDLAAFEVEVPVVLLLPLVDSERSLLLAAQNRILRLYTESNNGDLAVEQQNLATDVRITALGAAAQGTIYAATNRGVWTRSEDNKWRPFGSGLAAETIVAILPAQNGELCAIALGGAVWWLKDAVPAAATNLVND